jgi:hypothetical protein
VDDATIEGTWRQVRASLNLTAEKQTTYYYLAEHMFSKKCTAESADPFSRFIAVVRRVNKKRSSGRWRRK